MVKQLVVGTTGDYPPFSYLRVNSDYQGFDIELFNCFVDGRYQIKYINTSWPELESDLIARKFDVAIGGITLTQHRATTFSVTNSIYRNGKVALVHSDNLGNYYSLDRIDNEEVKVIYSR